jgi:hypothetical protein
MPVRGRVTFQLQVGQPPYEDGGVTYSRPNGEFWTILGN